MAPDRSGVNRRSARHACFTGTRSVRDF